MSGMEPNLRSSSARCRKFCPSFTNGVEGNILLVDQSGVSIVTVWTNQDSVLSRHGPIRGEYYYLADILSWPCSAQVYRLDISSSRSLVFLTGRKRDLQQSSGGH